MSSPLNSVFKIIKLPRLIIEASAGTGKTYTIVGLYVRLLVEEKLNVDEILVVTFTKKATAELRERILDRLRNCLKSLKNDDPGDAPFLKELLEWVDNKEEAAERIRNAIHDFDDSQVFTIHGFCQKVLKEEALISGTSFEIELDQSDTLLHQATEDFWRVFIDKYSSTDAGQYYINKLMEIGRTPAELIDNLYPLFGKPYAQTEGEVMDDPIQYLSDLLTLKKRLVDVWGSGKADILSILTKCDVSRYQRPLEGRLEKLERFFSDSSDQPEKEILKFFTWNYLSDESNLTKNGKATSHHPFFDLCDEYQELVELTDVVKNTVIKEAVEDIKTRRDQLLSSSSIVTYDDLLTKLKDALEDEKSGDALASILREKYPFTLVDEFQDTDPIQYSIFDQVYPQENTNTSLMMIGDPKQAIYAFRGADVYTYIQARKRVSGGKYSLEKNYRSTPKLIDAVNTLFAGDHIPFIEGEIEFTESKYGMPDLAGSLLLDGEEAPPMKIFYKAGVSDKKGESKEFAFRGTVLQIAELLEKSKEGKATIDNKKLVAGDIAVLVSSHKDAEEIKKMLKSVGIGAVTYSREKVFESFEARRLNLLMQAVLDPTNRQNVQNVLVSGFFGLDLNQIHNYQTDEKKRQELIDELLDLHELWHSNGFYPMFRKLMFSNSRLHNFTALENSERIITNLQQLADINSKAEMEGEMDPATLYRWYYKELSDPDKDDEKTLLLESDQNLVKIATIHGSKGLEFPVVFCPTLWEGREYKKQLLEEYHSGSNNSDLIINFDQSDSTQRKAAMNQFKIESVAEETRKMYVAITRAKYECRIFWAAHDQSHFSGLGAALLGSESVREAIESKEKLKNIEKKAEYSDQTFHQIFKNIEGNSSKTIQLVEVDDFKMPTERISLDDEAIEWNFKEYTGRTYLPVKRAVDSFSSLAHHKSEPGEPDYDQFIESYVDSLSTRESESNELSIFTFPRGATAGTLIHKLFEHEEFNFDKTEQKSRSDISMEVLEQYQFDEKWAPVLDEMLGNVSNSVIGDLELNKVSQTDELREMEFNLPISSPKLESLLSVIRNRKTHTIPNLNGSGFLTGFIDLIVRQNGKYYILDYKSNHLGDTIDDYAPAHLKAEMEAASYDLQYHLYVVALVKFLRNSQPDFDYERDFGGAAYLFVRGMRAGSKNGVWFHKPDVEIINKLEKTLDRL
ncbi:MAG: exodeoxyribonuclease V subunit beta [Balneolaceae bacterium]